MTFFGRCFWGGVGVLLVGGGVGVWRAEKTLKKQWETVRLSASLEAFDPLFVVSLVRAESGFSSDAQSHRGAVGLMQLMPETAKEMARSFGMDFKNLNLFDPETNLRLGVGYLAHLRHEFGGDKVILLAAYNAGPANARAWLKKGPLTEETIPFGETREFVRRVLKTEERLRWLQNLRNRWTP